MEKGSVFKILGKLNEVMHFLDFFFFQDYFTFIAGLQSSVSGLCCGGICINYMEKLTSLNAKFRALKTDENEIKILNITAMLFNLKQS